MIYIFYREGMFYPVEEADESRIPEHVKLNPGTRRVEDIDGRIVWEGAKH